MSFIYGTTLAADLFRISYQGIEAASDQTPAQNLTLPGRIVQAMKRNIALFDTYLSVEQYAFGLDRFQPWIIPLRLFSIGCALSQLQNDPSADAQAIGNMVILNLVNAGSVATRTLYPQLSSALLLADVFYRIFRIVSKKTALIDRIKDLTYQIDFQQIKDIAYRSFSYLGRAALVSLTIYAFYTKGKMDIQQATRLSTNTLHEIFRWTLLGSALASLIGITVHLSFKQMGMATNRRLILMDAAIASLSSALLLSLSAVGIGRVPSLAALVKPIYPAAITLVLGCVLWKVIRIAIHELFDRMGVQTGTLRTLEECAITAIGALPLTVSAAVGMGISKTIPESLALIGNIAAIGLFAIPCLVGSATLCGRTLLLGVPSWGELDTWFDNLNAAPATILKELFG